MVNKKSSEDGAPAGARAMGTAAGDLASAYLGNADAMARVKAATDAYANSGGDAGDSMTNEAAAANFNPHSPAKVNTGNAGRGPLLLIMGGKDHTVPEAVTKATLKQYRHSEATTDILEFADREHSLTIDHGWRDVAQAALDWLKQQGL